MNGLLPEPSPYTNGNSVITEFPVPYIDTLHIFVPIAAPEPVPKLMPMPDRSLLSKVMILVPLSILSQKSMSV